MIVRRNVFCPMRDGCRLATDLYLPGEDGAWPLVLMRTPYGRGGIEGDPLYGRFPELVSAGYAVAAQDLRGTGDSEGALGLNGQNEMEDGYDAVEWLAAQPFCDGAVGMFGLSYPGFVQTAAASCAPPHLKAICPFMSPSLHPFGIRSGHVRHMQHLYWAYAQALAHPEKYIPDPAARERVVSQLKENLPHLADMLMELPLDGCAAARFDEVPIFRDYLDVMAGAEDPEYWRKMRMPVDYDRVHVPALYGTGWLDAAREWTIEGFLAARKSADALTRDNARLLVGIWPHGGELPSVIEGEDFTDAASGDAAGVFEAMRRWFDRWLKGLEVPELPRVCYFVRGSNRWCTAPDWPPPQARMKRFYLGANGALDEAPAQERVEVRYTVDPTHPMPSDTVDAKGRRLTADWSAVTARADGALFCTEPLTRPLTFAGTMAARLYAAVDAPDTDYACRLLDIAPNGRQTELLSGLIRARHQNRRFEPRLIEPGAFIEYRWDVGNAANTFLPGHRVGLQVMGQLYPYCDRNLNTGESTAHGTRMRAACHRILTGGAEGSWIELPVTDAEEG